MFRLISLARRAVGLLRGCLLFVVIGLLLLGAGSCTALGFGIGRGLSMGEPESPVVVDSIAVDGAGTFVPTPSMSV